MQRRPALMISKRRVHPPRYDPDLGTWFGSVTKHSLLVRDVLDWSQIVNALAKSWPAFGNVNWPVLTN
jgi:hypothetical protein